MLPHSTSTATADVAPPPGASDTAAAAAARTPAAAAKAQRWEGKAFEWSKCWYPAAAEEHLDPSQPHKVRHAGAGGLFNAWFRFNTWFRLQLQLQSRLRLVAH